MIKNIKCNIKEETVTFDECINCSKQAFNCPVTPEYVLYLKSNISEMSSISVTKLLGCPRKAYLLKVIDYDINILDLYYAFRGGLTHLLLEKYNMQDCIIETEFSKEYNGVVITGKPDKIDIKNGIIYDYKTITGRIGDDRTLKWGAVRLKDQIQVNIYKWLVEDKFDIRKLVVVYFGTDFSIKKEVEIRQPNTKKYKDIQQAFDRALLLGKIWNKPLEQAIKEKLLPPTEKTWECDGYCDVSLFCKKLEDKK